MTLTMDPRVRRKLDKSGTFDLEIDCEIRGKPAGAGFDAQRLVLVGSGFGDEMAAPFSGVKILSADRLRRRVRLHGIEATIELPDHEAADQFDRALASRTVSVDSPDASTFGPIPRNRVTTLQTLPGWTIVQVLGTVSELSATSGFTATAQGTNALDTAMTQLRRSAGVMGASAIVGLTSSAFGAAGGITSAFGGDAVGVLLLGTAVVVADTSPEAAHGGGTEVAGPHTDADPHAG